MPEEIGAVGETKAPSHCSKVPNEGNSGFDRIVGIDAQPWVIDLEQLGLVRVQLEVAAFIQTGVAADIAIGFDGDPANQKIERNIAAVTVEDSASAW